MECKLHILRCRIHTVALTIVCVCVLFPICDYLFVSIFPCTHHVTNDSFESYHDICIRCFLQVVSSQMHLFACFLSFFSLFTRIYLPICIGQQNKTKLINCYRFDFILLFQLVELTGTYDLQIVNIHIQVCIFAPVIMSK